DVTLHDLDAANARPQGGQESIDECKQWICWLRSTGIESIDEWCASTRYLVQLVGLLLCNHIVRFHMLKTVKELLAISMLGNSYPNAGGPLSQSHVMGMLNDVNSSDNSPFDMNDFSQQTGPQGQLGANEDFPAFPRFKGVVTGEDIGNADYAMDMHQKEQLYDNAAPMMQSQYFSMGRSAGFSLRGIYSSHRTQQPQQHAPSVSSDGVSFSSINNQDLFHLHGSDIFPSTHSTYHSQASGPPGIGLRPLNSSNTVSSMGQYDQILQQYQQHQKESQFRLQMSAVNQLFQDQGMKAMQTAQSTPYPFGLLGLLSVIRMSDPDLTSLALGIDLTTLGLNLNSSENLHKTHLSMENTRVLNFARDELMHNHLPIKPGGKNM
ncbi:hypothetical protein S83_035270, partial [Arachis hypogaea]